MADPHNVQLETFHEEFEVLLTKTYGEDWSYSFDVEDWILLSLTIPYDGGCVCKDCNEDEEDGNGKQLEFAL